MLKKDEGFATSLKDVQLPDCAVELVASADKAAPKEEDTRVSLMGATTVGEALKASGASYLFIRVHLPGGTATVGECDAVRRAAAAARLVP